MSTTKGSGFSSRSNDTTISELDGVALEPEIG